MTFFYHSCLLTVVELLPSYFLLTFPPPIFRYSQTFVQEGKDCTLPVCVNPGGPVIKEGDVLLSTAPLGQRCHYACVRAKLKDVLKEVFAVQDERNAKFLEKQQGSRGEQAEKCSRIEATVGFAALAPDSDDELLEDS